MKRKTTLSTLALALVTLFASSASAKPSVAPGVANFDAKSGAAFAHKGKIGATKIASMFLASKADIARARAGLAAFLKKKRPARSPRLHRKLSKTVVQIVGFVTKGGERRLLMNHLCDTKWHRKWRKVPIFVDDGGDCYFSVEYRLKKGTYLNLQINGEA